ncbi:MAG: peptidase [Pusillimonas sp.]|nr:peptidase [Pusillimonas sp.]MBC42917.1 peptidase [Pusillimonas sp.]HCN73203.1 peptidase [Pusillimonas sp.]HCP79703.1 peptidase [Pusillimonas sp.]|tara:strand:+ start:343 stop:684 length:342 start_codon:yes stop_codon:yes gene_type:complete
MRSFKTAFLVVVFATTTSIFPLLSFADSERDDHDRARKALLDGKVLSLREVLDKVSRDFPGDPVEIEFEEDDGLYLYEIKLLQSKGTIVKLEVNAVNGEVLKAKGRNIQYGKD